MKKKQQQTGPVPRTGTLFRMAVDALRSRPVGTRVNLFGFWFRKTKKDGTVTFPG